MSAPLPAPRSEWIGPYRIEAKLGCGGMGEVYRAYDERLDRRVAIKLIRPEIAGHEKARERFRREATAAGRLKHPAIVHIYDILELEDGDAIVMELIEGPTLANLLRDGPLDLSGALRLALQIAQGLVAAHADGIVHRDLKTENVMVTPAGDAKILDFGLAKRFRQREDAEASLSLTEGIVGTSRAMSPEQVHCKRVDHRSDLFSFGTLLYEMLTGQSPFTGQSAFEIMSKICSAPQTPLRELNPEIPEPLAALVDHLLEKDVACRPQSAQEVAAALERIARVPVADPPLAAESSLDGEPTVIDDPRRIPSAKPQRRKWSDVRWALLLAVILLIGGLLALLPLYWQGPKEIQGQQESAQQSKGPKEATPRANGRQEPSEIKSLRLTYEAQKDLNSLYNLVEAEKQYGFITEARGHIKDFLRRDANPYAISYLAAFELGYGDAQKAISYYTKILSPEWEDLANLGTAYLIIERYDTAIEKFYEAQKLSPNNPGLILNLADAKMLYGDADEAKGLYEKVLELTASMDTKDAQLLTVRAQALAHLGKKEEAKRTAGKALDLEPDDKQVLYEVSLVCALSEEDEQAIAYAEKALEKGTGPGWFQLSWFGPLRGNSKFAERLRLKQHGGSGA